MDWERDVKFNRWLRAQDGLTPYQEAAKWRRQFWALVVLVTSVVFVFAIDAMLER